MKRSMVMKFIGIALTAGALFLLFHNRNQPENVINQKCINSCRSFEIYSSSQNILVSETAGNWSVYYNGKWFPADEDKIAVFINAIGTMKIYAESGSTEDAWPWLGVDTAHAVKLKFSGSACEEEIYFGKKVENSPYIFIRKDNVKQTYEADFPSDALYQNIFYWMRLKVYKDLNPSRINSLIIYRSEDTFKVLRMIVHGQDEWILEKSDRKTVLKRLAVQNLLEQIVNLTAERLADVSAESMKRIGRLRISLTSGKNYFLSFYNDSENKIYAASDRSSTLYILSAAVFRSIFPTYIKMLNTY